MFSLFLSGFQFTTDVRSGHSNVKGAKYVVNNNSGLFINAWVYGVVREGWVVQGMAGGSYHNHTIS